MSTSQTSPPRRSWKRRDLYSSSPSPDFTQNKCAPGFSKRSCWSACSMRRVPIEKICHNNRRATGDGSTKVRLSVGAGVVTMMVLYLIYAAPVHACGQEYDPGLMVSHRGFSAATASVATPGAH